MAASRSASTVEHARETELREHTGDVARSPGHRHQRRRGRPRGPAADSLGTYWPRDVARVLGLEPHDKAFIEIVDKDAVLVRFEKVDNA